MGMMLDWWSIVKWPVRRWSGRIVEADAIATMREQRVGVEGDFVRFMGE